jgi:glycine cleavage system regulatory protein/folate-dependent phosphoribosylglycinamide formyltransferase PurN
MTAGRSAAGTGGSEILADGRHRLQATIPSHAMGRASRRARQKDPAKMKCALVGSRYFGATVFEALRKETGVEFAVVVVPAGDDRLALAAKAAGVPVHVLADKKIVPGEAIPVGTELIIAAHTHARVSNEALARSRLGGVGYHPSLLPRHRGIAAVEWTILEGDAIAGGSVYHLADGWDAGAIAAQDWCFVARGESARELWERALAPMGLDLLARVVRHARDHGALPAHTQEPRFATRAPMIRRPVVVTDEAAPSPTTPLIATIIGPDRPGIVRLLSDRAQRHGASWTTGQMSRLAGEFAGMVHFEVPPENVDALAEALRGLESSGLRVAIAKSQRGQVPPGLRGVSIELSGDDRIGIVSQLTHIRISAHLLVPATLGNDELQQALGVLAQEMLIDIAIDDRPAVAAAAG